MNDTNVDIVTGAFSYTGKYIARDLLANGRSVRTLTNHPNRPDPFNGRVDAEPYRFDDIEALTRSLEGATTLYNTYWVRFNRADTTFDLAIDRSRMLFDAAHRAGVQRVVHVSIANPDRRPDLPYYRGKTLVEQSLMSAGVDFAIVQPTVLFGHEDVLINNIAWFIRRLHVFGIPGGGHFPIQPVHVEDVARACVAAQGTPNGSVIQAAGPETMTFRELVAAVKQAVGQPAIVTSIPPVLALWGTHAIGLLQRDVVLTREEITGLMAGLLACDGPVSGSIDFRDWLSGNASEIGRGYANELTRHFEPEHKTAQQLR